MRPRGGGRARRSGDSGDRVRSLDRGEFDRAVSDVSHIFLVAGTARGWRCAVRHGGEKPSRREGLAYYRSVVEWWKLNVRQYEDVTEIRRTDSGFDVVSQPSPGVEMTTPARAVVVATGYFASPNMLRVPGENLPHVSHEFVEGTSRFSGTRSWLAGETQPLNALLSSRAAARLSRSCISRRSSPTSSSRGFCPSSKRAWRTDRFRCAGTRALRRSSPNGSS